MNLVLVLLNKNSMISALILVKRSTQLVIVELYLKFRHIGFSIQRLWTNFVMINQH